MRNENWWLTLVPREGEMAARAAVRNAAFLLPGKPSWAFWAPRFSPSPARIHCGYAAVSGRGWKWRRGSFPTGSFRRGK